MKLEACFQFSVQILRTVAAIYYTIALTLACRHREWNDNVVRVEDQRALFFSIRLLPF